MSGISPSYLSSVLISDNPFPSFRRRRFNWPVDIPNWDVDIDDLSDVSKPGSAPIKPSQLRIPFETASTYSVPDVLDAPPYVLDTLTHVRTLRVYEAVKTADHSSNLLIPCSPSQA